MRQQNFLSVLISFFLISSAGFSWSWQRRDCIPSIHQGLLDTVFSIEMNMPLKNRRPGRVKCLHTSYPQENYALHGYEMLQLHTIAVLSGAVWWEQTSFSALLSGIFHAGSPLGLKVTAEQGVATASSCQFNCVEFEVFQDWGPTTSPIH